MYRLTTGLSCSVAIGSNQCELKLRTSPGGLEEDINEEVSLEVFGPLPETAYRGGREAFARYKR
jgi:hypothetical protein